MAKAATTPALIQECAGVLGHSVSSLNHPGLGPQPCAWTPKALWTLWTGPALSPLSLQPWLLCTASWQRLLWLLDPT